MEKVKMYMVTHKSVNYIPKGRIPIFVGNGKNENEYISDSLGDNISLKNKNYCELTALYWIWKNDLDSKYISIEHYRRFFMNNIIPHPINTKKMIHYLKDYDGIVTQEYVFNKSIKEYYQEKHISEDLLVVEDTIRRLYPEFLDDYHKVMNGNTTSMCNMIVLPKDKFNEYCKWLFDILFYVEKEIKIENRDTYQQRVFGFLSERLQNVWTLHSNLKLKRLPIYYLEKSKLRSIAKSIKKNNLKLYNN